MVRRLWIMVAVALLAVNSVACMPHVIDDGEVGVVNSLGTINPTELGTGFTVGVFLFREIDIRSVRLFEMTEEFSVPTSDGMLVDLEATLLVRRVSDQVAEQFINIAGNPWDTVVVPNFRSAIRTSVAQYPIEQVYQGAGRTQIATDTTDELNRVLGQYGFEVDSVLLRDVVLPDAFKQAVENKLTAEQKVVQKGFELEQAVKDAEIAVAKARGAKESQEIINSTLTDNYLRYLWIDTLAENPNVIYVATEANRHDDGTMHGVWLQARGTGAGEQHTLCVVPLTYACHW